MPEAKIYGHLPRSDATALRQHRRWEHGHLYLAFRTAQRLFLEGLINLDKNRIGLALEISVPHLSFVGLMWVTGATLSFALYLVYGHAYLLWVLVSTGLAFAFSILAAWMRFAGVRQTLDALASVPRYIGWKLPLYRDFFMRRETRWIKTDRD